MNEEQNRFLIGTSTAGYRYCMCMDRYHIKVVFTQSQLINHCYVYFFKSQFYRLSEIFYLAFDLLYVYKSHFYRVHVLQFYSRCIILIFCVRFYVTFPVRPIMLIKYSRLVSTNYQC